MELRLADNGQFSEGELMSMLNETGVIEVDQKDIH
jgi:hypothetical protein